MNLHWRLYRAGAEGHDRRRPRADRVHSGGAGHARSCVCSSVNVGSTRAGIDMDAVRPDAAQAVKDIAAAHGGHGRLPAAPSWSSSANAVEDNPVYGGRVPRRRARADCCINVGVSGPGVVKRALENEAKGQPFDVVAETIKTHGVPDYARGSAGGPGGLRAAERAVRHRRSVPCADARRWAIPWRTFWKKWGLRSAARHGTTAALALLNDAVKKGGVMASSHVGGLSGAFIPVSEDDRHDHRRRARRAQPLKSWRR